MTNSEKPSSFYELLGSIRRRPEAYLGNRSLHDLRVWLDGYRYARAQMGVNTPEEEEFTHFDTFVQNKYSWHDTSGFEAKIAYYHRDPSRAFDEFFTLLDEFRIARPVAAAAAAMSKRARTRVADPAPEPLPVQYSVDALAELARTVGVDSSALANEDARWDAYRRVIESRAHVDLLYSCVKSEPDPALASAVVVEVLETVPPQDRGRWVEAVDDSQKDSVRTREWEIGVLDSLNAGQKNVSDVKMSVDNWSNWLQQRIAETEMSWDVLAVIASRGRTKRIRRYASERLRRL
ncbi:hypothetical protein GCM10022198_03260 [Klugiella xanthotipulae]|uniref:Uncharacterized protein n=1 Tax=Klugiella xanthotipulae TaxID=244735 RepID=A0A543I718_9MICO|nr:hypothetical protein [Klugiella xanthotipulae]TQM66378.1 hypothetical protein FB466_1218 [Klugiella xanthotipulae]